MADYLGNLISRTLGQADDLQPRPVARFEPYPVMGDPAYRPPEWVPAVEGRVESSAQENTAVSASQAPGPAPMLRKGEPHTARTPVEAPQHGSREPPSSSRSKRLSDVGDAAVDAPESGEPAPGPVETLPSRLAAVSSRSPLSRSAEAAARDVAARQPDRRPAKLEDTAPGPDSMQAPSQAEAVDDVLRELVATSLDVHPGSPVRRRRDVNAPAAADPPTTRLQRKPESTTRETQPGIGVASADASQAQYRLEQTEIAPALRPLRVTASPIAEASSLDLESRPETDTVPFDANLTRFDLKPKLPTNRPSHSRSGDIHSRPAVNPTAQTGNPVSALDFGEAVETEREWRGLQTLAATRTPAAAYTGHAQTRAAPVSSRQVDVSQPEAVKTSTAGPDVPEAQPPRPKVAESSLLISASARSVTDHRQQTMKSVPAEGIREGLSTAVPELNVQVTIGRIEVRTAPPPARPPKPRPQPQGVSLDEYLRRRAQEGNR